MNEIENHYTNLIGRIVTVVEKMRESNPAILETKEEIKIVVGKFNEWFEEERGSATPGFFKMWTKFQRAHKEGDEEGQQRVQ